MERGEESKGRQDKSKCMEKEEGKIKGYQMLGGKSRMRGCPCVYGHRFYMESQTREGGAEEGLEKKWNSED